MAIEAPPDSLTGAPQIRRLVLAALLLAGISLATFWPVCRASLLNWDDQDQIERNPDFNPPRLTRMLEYVRGPWVGSLYPVAYWYLGALSALARHGNVFDPRVFH